MNIYNNVIKGTILLTAITSLSLSNTVHAIDIDPLDYVPAPAGTNLSILYNGFLRDRNGGNVGFDANVNIFRFVAYREFMGITIDPQILMPFGSQDLDIGGTGSLGTSGFADPILASTFWFVNDEKSKFGITPFLSVPIGSYDNNETLNMGTNTWVATMQAGYINNLTPKLALEVVGDVSVTSDNDDFGANSQTMKTGTGYQLQLLGSYKVSNSTTLGVNFSQQKFGKQEVNGVQTLASSKIEKASVYAQYWADKTVQIQAKYSRDLDVEDAARQPFKSQLFQLRLLKAF